MKKTLIVIVSLLLSSALFAQNPEQSHGNASRNKEVPLKIEDMVSNLSSIQKKQIESITEKSKKQVGKLKSELEAVRSQICKLHAKEGDQSTMLFPLYEKKGEIEAEIAKEMYRSRLQIDNVLTEEQVKEFRKCLESNRKKHSKDKYSQSTSPARQND